MNKWVKQLKLAYDATELGEEASKIGSPITIEEFQYFFRKKRESTESSPSTRHLGHYKVAAYNNDLSYMYVTMINIGLVCGIAMTRWKHAIDIMIEKDKGSPKLHRLRVIQLLEADLNFCLSLVFGKRMMKFATQYCGLSENQYGSKG